MGLSPIRLYIEQWNGTAWSIVSSPTISDGDEIDNLVNLVSVTCTSVSQCWNVGVNNGLTLIEQWNGTAWSIVSHPMRRLHWTTPSMALPIQSASNC